jgi:hypothetical protein
MDSTVSVRFFTVVPSVTGQVSFDICLKKLISLSANPSRVVDDVTIQAANMQEKGDRISGDLVRVQDENFPSLNSQARNTSGEAGSHQRCRIGAPHRLFVRQEH